MHLLLQTYSSGFAAVDWGSEEAEVDAGEQFHKAKNWLVHQLPKELTKATIGERDEMATAFATTYRNATSMLAVLETLSEPGLSCGSFRAEWLPSVLEAKWGESGRKAAQTWENFYGGDDNFPPLHLPHMRGKLIGLIELLIPRRIDINVGIPPFDDESR